MDGDAVMRVPCLTLLYHPDLARVGQRAVLDELMRNQTVQISRLEPLFAHPSSAGTDTAARGPIADPYVSASKPVRLTARWPQGIELAADKGSRLLVRGEALVGAHTIPLSDLQRGIVLVLARRVIVLLHQIDILQERADSMDLVGASDAIEGVRRSIARVADLDIPVLIRGESGVGKEHVARAIHEKSARADKPYMAVNMAAINKETAVAELFGHAKGAFTGATSRRAGLFEQCDGGALFLDEIADTPDAVQPMLLRVLQSGEIQPLGAPSLRVDVRIIAATDADLEAARERGAFRSALLHRLAGYAIQVPPLRERRDDIARLLCHFLRGELDRVGELERLAPPEGADRPWFPAKLMAQMVEYHWRDGNVRQLANAVRQLVVSNRGAEALRVDRAISELLTDAPTSPSDRMARPATTPSGDAEPKEANERARPEDIGEDQLVAVLLANKFAIRPTAAALGIAASTLYALIEKSKVLRKAKDLTKDELIECQRELDGDQDAMAEHLMVSKRALRMRLKELGLL